MQHKEQTADSRAERLEIKGQREERRGETAACLSLMIKLSQVQSSWPEYLRHHAMDDEW